MNRLLDDQLRLLGLNPDEPPSDRDAWSALLDCVGAYYDDVDRNRYVVGRSPEISSREMQETNEQVRDLAVREAERSEKIARHNFHELPVPAWFEDVRKVVARLDDLRASGVEDLTEYLGTHPEALFDLVERVEIIDFNPAASELVGATPGDPLGRLDTSGLGAGSAESWQRPFEAIWDGSGRVEFEFSGHRFDGTPFSAILHWSVAEIDGVFDFSRVMVVIIDITDRIAAEQELRRLVFAKDEFLASVSHELRTPLTTVVGYAELLLGDEVDPEEQRLMLATIVDQAVDLANLVEDILAGARADVGQLGVESSDVDLGGIIEGSLRSFPEVVRVGETDEPLIAIADGARVRQILRNLFTNAQKYGGSRIAIRLMVLDAHTLEISVCDDGPPVEAGLSGRVFERYFREQGDVGRTASVGIGLSISQDLARRMGGDLSYRHDGEWSEFVLTLPRAEQSADTAA